MAANLEVLEFKKEEDEEGNVETTDKYDFESQSGCEAVSSTLKSLT